MATVIGLTGMIQSENTESDGQSDLKKVRVCMIAILWRPQEFGWDFDDMGDEVREDYRVLLEFESTTHIIPDNMTYGRLDDLSDLVNLDGHPIKNRQTMRVSGCTWMGWTPSN